LAFGQDSPTQKIEDEKVEATVKVCGKSRKSVSTAFSMNF